ncbi:MAG: hypothetical protein LIO92_02475, partial [Clostridiales bacterium]|nr:hypothetical protein [Clostridiales bacterium]
MATSLYPDISHYHPVKDWAKVKASCPFLICKATEGTTFIDTSLEDFIVGCEENKISYWLFAYLRKGNEVDQAQFLISACKEKTGDYFVGYALDIEEENSAANVKAALGYLAGLGVKTLLYTMYSQYGIYKTVIESRPSDCAFWEARYGENTGFYDAKYAPHTCDLHQYTSKGICAGITGVCDLNRIAGSKKEEWFKTKKTILTIDGKWGTATCKRAQEVFGTTQDGYISGQPTGLKKYHAGISCAKYAVHGSGSQLIKAIQKKTGVVQDGKLGPVTIRAMQTYLGPPPDGTIYIQAQKLLAGR